MSNLPSATDQNWKSEVLGAPAALVDFWADGWGGCKVLAPVVEQIAKDYAGKVKVLSAKIDDAGETAAELGVFGLPTVVLYKAGKEVGRLSGPVKREKLVDEIKKKIGV